MKLLESFAKAVIDIFQGCLTDDIPRSPILSKPLDEPIVAQRSAYFVHNCVADMLTEQA